MYIINNFLFFSLLGHLLEKIFNYNGTSGILYFYWTPIYGFTVLTLYYIFSKLDHFHLKTFLKWIVLYITGFIAITFYEELGGILIEKLFGIVFWNYTKMKFNVGKYICLEMALLWGVCGIILYYVKPFIDKIIKRIPKSITFTVLILFILDVIATFLTRSVLFT